MRTRTTDLYLSIAVVLVLCPAVVRGNIESTPHNLGATGGADTCGFCHTPHGALAGTPLWNHKLSNAVYKIYQSSSTEANIGQPTGSSKLCLSCHDGTVALAESISGSSVGGAYIAPGAANLGTDLSDDHPISFVYDSQLVAQDAQLRHPAALPEQLKLDRGGELQCTTCHDAHDNKYGNFLVMPNDQSQMCLACHVLTGWSFSSHQSSNASVLGANDDYLRDNGYSTVADAACQSCHRPHSAGGSERLLHFAMEEENCLNCHNGSVAQTNLETQMNRISGHDVRRYDGIHDIRENPAAMMEHVECVDCHNPHLTETSLTQAPFIRGVMRGASGVAASGAPVVQAQYEYEVCFKCHGDNPTSVSRLQTRVNTQFNTRLEFDPSNPSFHPIEAPGANQNVPSLIAPLTVASMIYCTDCHSTDSSSGVAGPHGSNYLHLLCDRYETADFTPESSSSYALCYKCHSRNSIRNDESFPQHETHLDDEIPCSACHDAHGISLAQGTMNDSTHLINFDVQIVQPDPVTGRLEFQDLGTFHGRCYLRCHDETHSPKDY